jgi:hypothetical protein
MQMWGFWMGSNGMSSGQQRNVVIVVAVIKPVQPRNVVKILLDEVA